MSSTSRPVIHSSLDSCHGKFCPCGSTVPRPLSELRLEKGTFRSEWLSIRFAQMAPGQAPQAQGAWKTKGTSHAQIIKDCQGAR
jgi:hypothetical protein